MKASDVEPLVAAPRLLRAFRKGREEFGVAAMRYATEPRVPVIDAGVQECLELLDHLVERLREERGGEEACIFLLEHLAARFQENTRNVAGALIH
jgi:hypothetical protein